MKYFLFSIGIIFLLSLKLTAQDLPLPSPQSSVSQVIGVTEIRIDYHSPGVKDRTIWGKLVPWDKVWRTGANDNTTITVEHDVEIGGKHLSAGKYGLFTIPNKDKWTVIINSSNEDWGAYRYKKEKDILRLEAKPQPAEFLERMAFDIAPINDSSGTITLRWEKIKISIPVKVDIYGPSFKNIETALAKGEKKAGILIKAAGFCYKHNTKTDQALTWINESIKLEDSFTANWIKAKLLARKGKYKKALSLGKKADEAGAKKNNYYYNQVYKPEMDKMMPQWKKQK